MVISDKGKEMQIREEKARRPAPIKTPRSIIRPSDNGWKVMCMEIPAKGGTPTSSVVHGYVDKSESACRIKADELNAKVKLGENAPLISYVAMKK
jgi:hypothetical protein